MRREDFAPRVPHERIATVTKLPSTAAIREHPLHPMLVNFPIAFLSSALLTDLVFWWTRDPFWAQVSFWLIAGGFVMGSLAAIAGMTDFFSGHEIRVHPTAWNHFLAGVTLLAFTAANLVLRWTDPVAAVLPWGVFTSAITVVILAVAGWLGGRLVFHYLIGTGEGRIIEQAAEDKRGSFKRRPPSER